MITTNTGAKKLESSDNWREIFPNPGTSAAGAHNASVDAHDRIQAEVAPIINGKRCSLGAASGEYVLLRNSTITGKTDGAYVAAKAIPANTDLDSTYLGSPITGGLVNELNSNLTQQYSNTIYENNYVDIRVRQWLKVVMLSIEYNSVKVKLNAGSDYILCTLPSGSQPAQDMYLSMPFYVGANVEPMVFQVTIGRNGGVMICPNKDVETNMTIFGHMVFLCA